MRGLRGDVKARGEGRRTIRQSSGVANVTANSCMQLHATVNTDGAWTSDDQ